MTVLKFSKMHGLGNDFMVVDAITQRIFVNAKMIQKWACRHRGIGFDQLLLLSRRLALKLISIIAYLMPMVVKSSNVVMGRDVLHALCIVKNSHLKSSWWSVPRKAR